MYCIQCGTLQTAGAVYCKICGARLSEQKMDPTYRVQNIPSGAYVPPMYGAPEDPTPTRFFVEAKHSGKRCPVCGKSMPVNAAFCVSCGLRGRKLPTALMRPGRSTVLHGKDIRFELPFW